MVLTPPLGDAATTCGRALAQDGDGLQANQAGTADHDDLHSLVALRVGRRRWSSLGCAAIRDARFFPRASGRKPGKKVLRTRQTKCRTPFAPGGVCDRVIHARKSRSQRSNPYAAHPCDDRGRDNGAHRDACNPKAIRVAPIYAVRD
jgi:hypothetical protein